jgi:molybdenum cofactor biosynthesis enzyme MoaA
MTSNGIALPRNLASLVDHGLTHLNLSLDTLDPFTFELITRRQGHQAVLRTLDLALAESRLRSVKLNVVVIKGLNEREVIDFVELTKDRKLSVRFIEVNLCQLKVHDGVFTLKGYKIISSCHSQVSAICSAALRA